MTVIRFKPQKRCTTRILREHLAETGLSPRCEFRQEGVIVHVEALVRRDASIQVFEAIAAQGVTPRWDIAYGVDNKDFVIVEAYIARDDIQGAINGFAAGGVAEARVYQA